MRQHLFKLFGLHVFHRLGDLELAYDALVLLHDALDFNEPLQDLVAIGPALDT